LNHFAKVKRSIERGTLLVYRCACCTTVWTGEIVPLSFGSAPFILAGDSINIKRFARATFGSLAHPKPEKRFRLRVLVSYASIEILVSR
jgi:hypothetical protein